MDLLGHRAVLAEFAGETTSSLIHGQLVSRSFAFWKGHLWGELPFVAFHIIEVKSFLSLRMKRLWQFSGLVRSAAISDSAMWPCVMMWALTEGSAVFSVDVVEDVT